MKREGFGDERSDGEGRVGYRGKGVSDDYR